MPPKKRLSSAAKSNATLSVYNKVTETDIELCTRIFNSLDEKSRGYLNYNEQQMGLKQVGVEFSHSNVFHKMISELPDQSGSIRFSDFQRIYQKRRDCLIDGDDPGDVLGAYVALGGEEDGGGNIDADRLIDIIKNEFEMTIDIEGLINVIDKDGSGEIEFEEFQALLNNEGNNPEIESFADWFGI